MTCRGQDDVAANEYCVVGNSHTFFTIFNFHLISTLISFCHIFKQSFTCLMGRSQNCETKENVFLYLYVFVWRHLIHLNFNCFLIKSISLRKKFIIKRVSCLFLSFLVVDESFDFLIIFFSFLYVNRINFQSYTIDREVDHHTLKVSSWFCNKHSIFYLIWSMNQASKQKMNKNFIVSNVICLNILFHTQFSCWFRFSNVIKVNKTDQNWNFSFCIKFNFN